MYGETARESRPIPVNDESRETIKDISWDIDECTARTDENLLYIYQFLTGEELDILGHRDVNNFHDCLETIKIRSRRTLEITEKIISVLYK